MSTTLKMKSDANSPIKHRFRPKFVTVVSLICYVFLIVPTLIVIPISFGNQNDLQFPPTSYSLALFSQFFGDAGWWKSVVQSAIVAVLTTALTLLLCLPAAFSLQRSALWGRKAIHALAMAPLLVPVVVLGLGLYLQFSVLGLLDQTTSLVLSHTMLATPFVMVSLTSGLAHIDPALESAALVMGASKTRIFFKVVLPQLKSALFAGGFFAFLISFDEVVVAFFLTGPNTQTLPVKMYSAIRWEISPIIAVVATLLTVLSLVLGLVNMKIRKDEPTALK
jgi:putative spermidine/putrescine transport system permease protein